MDEKDFVSFETAKKLKETGFDYPCYWYYTSENAPAGCYWVVYTGTLPVKNTTENSNYSKPELYQAQKWLREVKGIDITITVYREIDETVSSRKIKRFYECEITTEDDEDYIPYSEYEKDFPSYETALSAGIDAVLELITNKTE